MELETWRKKVVELNEVNFINQDQILKLTEMTMMQTQEQQNLLNKVHEFKKGMEEAKAKLETANSGINQASDEEKTLLIESLKVENEGLKHKQNDILEKQRGTEAKLSSLNQTIEERNKKIETLEIKLSATLRKLTSLTAVEDDLSNANQKIEYLTGELERARASGSADGSAPSPSMMADIETAAQEIIEGATAQAQKIIEDAKQQAIQFKSVGGQQGENAAELQIKIIELEKSLEELRQTSINLKKDNKLLRREVEMYRDGLSLK